MKSDIFGPPFIRDFNKELLYYTITVGKSEILNRPVKLEMEIRIPRKIGATSII